jgi:hypothetical protein
MHRETISILQNNINKSQRRTHSILNHPTSSSFAVLALQEPYWSEYTKSCLMHHAWTLVQPPPDDQGQKPRSVMYINNELLPTKEYEIINMPFRDVTAIAVTTSTKPFLLINVYNSQKNDIITPLQRHIHNTINIQQYDAIIILGDFNLHHPLWNPPHYEKHEDKADNLIQMMTTLGLNLVIPEGTITFPRSGTAIDLVWGNNTAENLILRCGIANTRDHGSDHLAI